MLKKFLAIAFSLAIFVPAYDVYFRGYYNPYYMPYYYAPHYYHPMLWSPPCTTPMPDWRAP